ncbi:DUF2939 domain-containing protein [Aurantiacibacter sp. D1-12]|uniref:DUF2939 domain-containing protein n=1 Tax=Aurantiacibacter sp. D1-12 TaxID=2993658 RepID=UPI00237D0C03|nr:DUF2939 domain-containing protein [Aurantiacibacter sp. D1-12]MDE1466368.1 DUF2939 domain-containing protein [Aurantiacibacter sp. D1-12]
MKKLLTLILLAALAFGGWYFASPWWAMKSLADAAQAGDMAALEERVDFPALRASASEQLGDAVQRQRDEGGILGEIGGAIADRLGDEVIDRTVTPNSVGALVASGAFVVGMLPERLRGQELSWDVEREGLDNFRAHGTFEDGTRGPTLIFRREGLGWVMTGFELRDPNEPTNEFGSF